MGKKIRSLQEPKRGLFIYVHTIAGQNCHVSIHQYCLFKQHQGHNCPAEVTGNQASTISDSCNASHCLAPLCRTCDRDVIRYVKGYDVLGFDHLDPQSEQG